MTLTRIRLRDFSREFNENCEADSLQVVQAVLNLSDQISDLRRSRKQKVMEYPRIAIHVKAIVLELYMAYRNPPFVYRGISRRAQEYSSTSTRYKRIVLGYRHTVGVLDDLTELGFIKQYPGFFDRQSGNGYRTRIRARQRLVTLLESFGVSPEMIRRVMPESIYLRDRNKQFIEYEDTDETRQMRFRLDAINQALQRRRIGLYMSNSEMDDLLQRMAQDPARGPLDFNAVTLRRIFNNSSFEQGGRFYGGWWQRIPKEARPYIYIDHKNTIEIDFAGLHVRMLYGQAGVDCPDDPYDLTEYPREDQKAALLIMLNVDSAKSAIKAVKRKGLDNAKQLCNALASRHAPIAANFYTGIGTWLQFKDSAVAEAVMLKIIALGGIALPVHDSFIVRVGRENELEAAMNEAFNEVYPNTPSRHKRKVDLLELTHSTRLPSDEPEEISMHLKTLTDSDWQRLMNS